MSRDSSSSHCVILGIVSNSFPLSSALDVMKNTMPSIVLLAVHVFSKSASVCHARFPSFLSILFAARKQNVSRIRVVWSWAKKIEHEGSVKCVHHISAAL